jgi:LacI family transcriptional regulator
MSLMSSVSLTDIARKLGLSHATVSLVLNDKPIRVSKETRQRIQQTAKKLHYRPNSVARAMRSSRFQQIGMLLDYDTELLHFPSFEFLTLCGATDFLTERNWRLLVFRTSAATRNNPTEFLFMRERSLDALIATDLRSNLRTVLSRFSIPCISVNAPPGTNTVSVDDFTIAYEATQYLLKMGHRRIVFYSFNDYPVTVAGRRKGYVAALREAGLSPAVVQDGHFGIFITETPQEKEKAEKEMRETFRACIAQHRPTAFLVLADYVAYRLYAFAAEEKLHIPDDISILALDSSFEAAGLANPPLSAYKVRFYEIGRTAAEMAMKLVSGKSPSLPGKKVGADFVARASVGPPAK